MEKKKIKLTHELWAKILAFVLLGIFLAVLAAGIFEAMMQYNGLPSYKSADDFFSDIGTDIETDYWRFLEYGTIFIDPNPFVSQQRKTINKYLKNVYKEMLVKAGLEVI